MQDIRYGLRMMRRSPGFTAVAVLSLALGIGANSAIFSLIDTLMLRPLSVRDPQQLVEPLSRYPDPAEPLHNGYPWKHFVRFRDGNHVFSDVIGVSPSRFHLKADGLDADAVDGEYVVGNFFDVLGVKPAIGRLIGRQDDELGSSKAAVAVLSWASWNRRFHRDPDIIGKRITVEAAQATVIGVAPREFFGLQVGAAPEIWLPAAIEPIVHQPSARMSGQLNVAVMARLKPGVSLDQARAELLVLDRPRIEEIAARGDLKWLKTTIEVVPAAAGFSTLSREYARPLFALMVIVAALLLLACTNVAGLLLARAAARQREMTVRLALGAGWLRLVRQVLSESMLLAAAGCLLGIVFAWFGADALVRILTSGRIPGMQAHIAIQPHLDLRVLLFTVAVSLATGVLFGVAPAVSVWQPAPAASLRATGAAPETPSRRVIGKGLVIAQVALSTILLAAAGLFVRHVYTLRNVGLGFQREFVLLVTLDPGGSGYQENQLAPIYRQLLERLTAIPGVRSAALSGITPVSGAGASRFIDVPRFEEKREDRRRVALNWIAPKYFETLGTPLLAGRDFTFEDQGGPLTAIVNHSMARYYFGDRNPIGQFFTFDRQDNRGAARQEPYRIVGVVGDTKYLNLQEPIWRMVYLNAFQEPRLSAHQFSLRTNVRPEVVAGSVRRTVRELLPTVVIARVTTMTDQIDASMIPERLIAMLSGFFGGVGALLAAIGLYGLLAYTVARRTSEIGVRMALGATRSEVTRMVMMSALGLVAAGLVLGAPLAYGARRLAAAFVDDLPIGGVFPIAAAAVAMLVIAAVAAAIPARRASCVNPIEALRQE
jgi:putative ABC transport system permease protein